MNDRRGSTDEGIWIVLCLFALLLLAGGGGYMWLRHQQTAQAMQAAQMAREAAEVNRLHAEVAMERAEAARTQAVNSQFEPAGTEPEARDPAAASWQPAVPELYLNQDLWQHVESLDDAGPDDKVFTIDAVSGEVTFGEGVHGPTVPDEPATIQATYHTAGGGTVTVDLPQTDLRTSHLRAVLSPDGILRLEIVDSVPDNH